MSNSEINLGLYGQYLVTFKFLSKSSHFTTLISGIETGGSGGSMNRDPKLLGDPESGVKKFYGRKEHAT